jgi:hypothetical protein
LEKSYDSADRSRLDQYFQSVRELEGRLQRNIEWESRPKPQVLIEHTNKTTYKTEQVLASEGVWAVFYDSHPINLQTSNMLVQYPGPKYKKVSFSNPGHAKNLARKLNAQFKTDKFTVVLLKSGDQAYP